MQWEPKGFGSSGIRVNNEIELKLYSNSEMGLQLKVICYIILHPFVLISVLMSLLVDPLSCWSADECANFVSGLRQYGKDFYLIHQNKVVYVRCTIVHLHLSTYHTVFIK